MIGFSKMGALLRSEDMQLVQLFVQVEAAHDTVDELGQLGLVQFVDLNPEVNSFQRSFVSEVKRCEEMERKLRFFDEQVKDEVRKMYTENSVEDLRAASKALNAKAIYTGRLFTSGDRNQLESQLDDLETELIQMNTNQANLNRNHNELIELRYVLNKDSSFFSETVEVHEELEEDDSKNLLEQDPNSPTAGGMVSLSRTLNLGFITGMVSRAKFSSFERVLWRSTRGNLFMKHSEIEEAIQDPQTGEMLEKNVFIIFYQGERSQTKIKKICESFSANVYNCPNTSQARKTLLQEVNGRIEDLEAVLASSRKHRRQILLSIAEQIKSWTVTVTKEKSIYHTMNLFNYDVGRRCLIAEGWCPKIATESVVSAMRRATTSSGASVPSILSVVPTKDEPPTYNRTNKFTSAFQSIVDAYGIAHYKEVNPGPFTIITFPFLFAVMFGDFGHGFMMALFASYLVIRERKLANGKLNEMVKTAYDGRYVILMMGLFSMYTGLIYNTAFGVSLDLFGSNYHYVGNATVATRINPDATYPFGVDPVWTGASNSLLFYNSLKMKLSVILGVTQMVLGIILSALNGFYHHSMIDVFGEFVPQLIFMLSLFGYLCFLIIYKWCIPVSDWPSINGGQAPDLLNVMIEMFLSIGSLQPINTVYSGQWTVQMVLIVLALGSIPWMLFLKPYALKFQYQKSLSNGNISLPSLDGESNEKKDTELEGKDKEHPEPSAASQGHSENSEGKFEFSEVIIKQIIHTIEFVLGAISNTASYLRLWALSLAHSELTEVFLDKVLIYTLSFTSSVGFILVFFGFAIWAGATFAVLLIMESLSAFLHALRLHWVEFQSKFYVGDGNPFAPFSYKIIFNPDEDSS